MDLSIIVVNYRTYNLTKQTIESVLKRDHPFSYEIFLVDSASGDGSLERLEEYFSKETEQGLIRFISSKENRGFAHANNQALKETDSKYVLLLNSDTVVVDDCLERCIEYMEKDERIGALGCKVLLPDGKLDKACRRSFPTVGVSFYRMTGLSKLFPKSKRFGRYNLTYLDENETYEVDCIMGAFMMVRSNTIEDVGLLDETFFMYGEDIDWCYRIRAGNWKIIYYSDAQIIHYKGGSLNKKEKPKMIYEFYRAMHLFYNKHYKNNYPKTVTAITYLGIWSMYCLKRFINFFR
ncbi:glycosyltransferase family 2 protein [Methanobacterium aggregans]|uniref:glycosyltransferase family 2 protein n=1 Tax=Methanobacterium aggregans TaxID=1615586 RepID=UPI00320CA65D